MSLSNLCSQTGRPQIDMAYNYIEAACGSNARRLNAIEATIASLNAPGGNTIVANDLTVEGKLVTNTFEVANKWVVDDTGFLVPYTSGTFDIGTAATRVRTGYFTGLSVDGPGGFQDNLFVGNEATTTKGIEVGNPGAAGTAPYLDFRFGTGVATDDFNMRLINNGPGRLGVNQWGVGEVLILDNRNMAINVNGNLVPTSEFCGGQGVTYIRAAGAINPPIPGNFPINGGILYVDGGGALRYRGPLTDSQVAPA